MLWLEGSHVSSYLFERKAFALMAKESADRVQLFLDNHPEYCCYDVYSSKQSNINTL